MMGNGFPFESSAVRHRVKLNLSVVILALITTWPAPPTARSAPTTAAVVTSDRRSTPIAPELRGRIVEDIQITGNTQVSTAVIRNYIRTTVGQPLDPATVEEDYQRIFSLKKFANVEARVERTSTGVIVDFHITEHKQIREIRFVGNTHAEAGTLLDVIDLKAGEAIDHFRINLAKLAIERYYRDHNYTYAHVNIASQALEERGIVLFNITEGPNIRVRNVAMVGAKSFTADKLKDQIKTSSWVWIFRRGKLDLDQLEDDIGSIRRFYEQHGFFDVRVGRKLLFSANQGEVEVQFLIDEGRRYTVNHISFVNNHALSEAELRRNLKLVEGMPYNLDIVRRDVRQMVKAYSPLGFIYLPRSSAPEYLRIDPRTRFYEDAGKVDLVYNINEGHTFHVGRVLVKGNSKTQDVVWLRLLRVNPGQLYNSYELEQAADRMKGTSLISSVTITPIGDDPNVRDVLVEVQETQTAFILFGAGVTSSLGVLGNISYEQRNFDISNVPGSFRELFSRNAFTGRGQYFKVVFEPGTQLTQGRVIFDEPWLFDQPYSLHTDTFYSTVDREHYYEGRFGERLSIGKQFNNYNVLRLNLRAEQVEINHIDNRQNRAFEILQLAGHSNITGAGLDYRRDTSDSTILPSKGTKFDVSYEYAGAFGGDYHFNKVEASFSLYQLIREDLLDRKTTLTWRLNSGYIWGGRSPFFERFYAGGLGSVRGFRYRGISPRSGIDDDPIGGNFTITGGVELNFPIYQELLRGVVFADAGTVENNARFGTIRTSIGAGVRVTLPIFGQIPLALDFGFPLTKDRRDDTRIVSFQLGFGS